MVRVDLGHKWSLFDPSDVPSLFDVYGNAFTTEYRRLEAKVTPVRVVEARVLWLRILQVQAETGCPFVMYSDAINGECEVFIDATILTRDVR